jgi:hypothetical protein
MLADVRYAARLLLKQPAFTLIATFVLALGMQLYTIVGILPPSFRFPAGTDD